MEDYPLLKENTEPYLRSLTYDGNLIAIPRRTVDRVGGLILREDWLENLNLEMPKTLDDFYNVFYAFTYDDPDGNGVDDTIGLAMAGLDQRALKAASGITAWDYFVDEEAKEVDIVAWSRATRSILILSRSAMMTVLLPRTLPQ